MTDYQTLSEAVAASFNQDANVFIVIAPDQDGMVTVNVQIPPDYAENFRNILTDIINSLDLDTH